MRRIGLAVLITVVSLIAPFDPLAGESTKGWYLLGPPVDETSNVLFGILNQAPLTQWKCIATYDTEAACDQGSRAEGDARGRRLHPRSTARRIVEAAPGRGTARRTGASERAGQWARRPRPYLH